MSTLHRVQPVPAHRSTVAAVWTIARSAVRASRPDLVSAVPPSHANRPLLLRVRCDSARSCEAEIEDTATGTITPIEIGAVRVSTTHIDGSTHTDARTDDRRILAISVTSAEDKDGPIYAATDLLAELGIAGGRYSRPIIERRSKPL